MKHTGLRTLLPLCGMMLASSVAAQTTYSGYVSDPAGLPAYEVTHPAWSFHAEVVYSSQGYAREIAEITHTVAGTAVKRWKGEALPPKTIAKNRRPDWIQYYDARRPQVVLQAIPEMRAPVYSPTPGTCLTVLQQKLAKYGADGIRRQYGIPANFPVGDISGLRAERFAGAVTQGGGPDGFGPNFLVNNLPSGFGWPMLMFKLTVCTPKALAASGIGPLKAVGREKIAGWLCTKYVTSKGDVTLWIEPNTQLALREETRVTPRPFPGSRIPPVKPYTTGYEVRQFRLIKQAPHSAFVPPPGSVVELPHLLSDFALPAGLQRRTLSGTRARLGQMEKLGVPITSFASGAAVIR